MQGNGGKEGIGVRKDEMQWKMVHWHVTCWFKTSLEKVEDCSNFTGP